MILRAMYIPSSQIKEKKMLSLCYVYSGLNTCKSFFSYINYKFQSTVSFGDFSMIKVMKKCSQNKN